MKHFTICLLTMLLIVACNKSEDDSPQPAETIERTVIVYMSGENDLSTFAVYDLNEMMTGSKDKPANGRFVVFVDRDTPYQKPYIIEIKDGVCDTIFTYENDFYSSDPEHFTQVISTIQARYPAKDYGLVLWGHANGWLVMSDSVATTAAPPRLKAYGPDNGNNLSYSFTERWMNITQMGKALAQLPRFRFILADCCCMMSAECAYELRQYTDYLIGSPAEIPGDGAPYHLIVKDLFLNTDDFYKNIIDDYYNYYKELYTTSEWTNDPSTRYLAQHSLPLSVVDMRYIEPLAAATSLMLQQPDSFKTDSVPYYFDHDMPVSYDMGCILEHNSTAEAYQQWVQALHLAVPYRRFSARWLTNYSSLRWNMQQNSFRLTEDNYSGLSMFIPQSKYNFSSLYNYNATFPSFQWYEAVGWQHYILF